MAKVVTAGLPPKIVVVGSTNTDLVVGVPRIPAPGETVLGGELRTVAGGKGANQAVACARMGARVTFVARIGDDTFGQAALEGLHREGIDCEFVRTTGGIASGVALISVNETTGENAIVVAPGANALLSASDVQAAAAAFETAQAVVISQEVPEDTVRMAVEMGHARGIAVILNPAPARPLPAFLLPLLTVLTPNEGEARLLADVEDETDATFAAQVLRHRGVPCVVMTRGAHGAQVCDATAVTDIAAFTAQAVDTVAAGDCFTGALAVEMARGTDIRDAARFACAASALKVTRRGAQDGLPARAEVEAFLREQGA